LTAIWPLPCCQLRGGPATASTSQINTAVAVVFLTSAFSREGNSRRKFNCAAVEVFLRVAVHAEEY